MTSIGARLREERKRLGLNQTDFADLGLLTKQTLIKYESDQRSPDTIFLGNLSGAGADVLYIVTGRREPGHSANPAIGSANNSDRALDGFAAAFPPELLRLALLDLGGSALIRAAGPAGNPLPLQRLVDLLAEIVMHTHAAVGSDATPALQRHRLAELLPLIDDLRAEVLCAGA